MHSKVQTHSGHALSPPPKGMDVSGDTKVKSVLAEHSNKQVELKAILSFLLFLLFSNILALLKIKEHHSSFSSYVLLF